MPGLAQGGLGGPGQCPSSRTHCPSSSAAPPSMLPFSSCASSQPCSSVVKRIVTSTGGRTDAFAVAGDRWQPVSARRISSRAPSRTPQPPIRFTKGTMRSTNACLW